jgi:hypothetical protein
MITAFTRVLSADGLARPFAVQFLGESSVFVGRMDVVWHRPFWLRPAFAVLARWNVLFPETGSDIEAELVIGAHPGGGQSWRRRFRFERERRFDAVLRWDARLKAVVERTGPFDVRWDVRLVTPSLIEVHSDGCALRLRRLRVVLPSWLLPEVFVVERALGSTRIHVDLVVRQRPFGEIFGYSGTFELVGSR